VGPIEEVKVVRDKSSNRSLGYGFVKYFDKQNALDAKKSLNGYQYGGKTLKVSVARAREHSTSLSKLYIANIPLSFAADDVSNLFSEVSWP
jgi:RNA recognition motif-containing protein